MENEQLNSEIPQYSVSVWEVILIVMGAIALFGAAFIGLGLKVLANAYNPTKAEAIAKSLIDYQIPGGSQGIFGINIGSAKLAWVRSTTNPPDVILFVGKTPINKETNENDSSQGLENPPSDNVNEEFTVTASRTENNLFCGKSVPITIEQGQQTLSNPPSSVPAIRYTARTREGNVEQIVILIANGENAQAKAVSVFNSLRCH
ncbi:MAG TPA: hypothetical protein V6D11_24510 [Waterburya sp.]|jgi:hypothetical protein